MCHAQLSALGDALELFFFCTLIAVILVVVLIAIGAISDLY